MNLLFLYCSSAKQMDVHPLACGMLFQSPNLFRYPYAHLRPDVCRVQRFRARESDIFHLQHYGDRVLHVGCSRLLLGTGQKGR